MGRTAAARLSTCRPNLLFVADQVHLHLGNQWMHVSILKQILRWSRDHR